jgi:polyvinyl alcohol dehydrogenase (cytochrome)
MRTQLRNILITFAFVASLSAVIVGLHAQGGAISSPPPPAASTARDPNAVSSQAAGEALFGTYCATCHEGRSANPQAPGRDVMRRMSAEQILESLERGAMRTRAAERSRAQRRALAEYLSGKPLGVGYGGSIPKSAFCAAAPALRADALGGPAWNGWGNGTANARFQSEDAAGLKADDLSRLKLKWAFGFPGATSAGTQPVVIGGRVYVATAEGDVYVLDAKTGCVHWTLEVEAGIRSAMTIEQRGNGQLVAYFGDQTANVYAVDASVGKVLWKVEIDEHPHAAITAAPQLYGGRLYVPVSSREESQVGDARYPCCSFRGSVVALDAGTGARIWKTYSVAQAAVPTAKNSIGTQLYGPAGGAIWNTPTIDARRNVLYVGTGNNFAPPATELSDSLVALDLNTGAVRWSRQVTENDIWNGSCRQPDREAAVCPDKDAPDFDFTGSALLVDVGNGRQLIVVGNKSGVIFGFDPDAAGTIVWQRRVAVGSSSGGVFWGSATDGVNIYAANADFLADKPAASGGMNAVASGPGA